MLVSFRLCPVVVPQKGHQSPSHLPLEGSPCEFSLSMINLLCVFAVAGVQAHMCWACTHPSASSCLPKAKGCSHIFQHLQDLIHAWYLTRNSVLSESQTPSACPVPSIRMLGLYCRDEKTVTINLLSFPEGFVSWIFCSAG